MKLQKLKAVWIAAMVAMAALTGAVPVYAAEVSAESTEIRENKEKSTVFVFGAAIAMTYADGTVEIIPNNPSGRVDVMIAGKLYKGMGKVTVAAGDEKMAPSMVLEKNSFFVKGVTKETAAAVSEKAKQAVLANTTVDSLSDVKGLETSGILYVNSEGNLETADGKAVTADKAGVSLTTVEKAYADHAEALKEAEKVVIERPLEKEVTVSSSSSDNGSCKHPNLKHYTNQRKILKREGSTAYYATKVDVCPDCGETYTYTDNLWIHGDVEGASERHDWVSAGEMYNHWEPIGDENYKVIGCHVKEVKKCTKCNALESKEYDKIHADTLTGDQVCDICGYNLKGERPSNTGSENNNSEPEGE